MKWILLIVKNLFRNKKRTLLTMGAVALALFIFTVLQTVNSALAMDIALGTGETKLGVIERYSGPRRQLPENYWGQLQQFDGVTSVTPTNFAIVTVGMESNYFVAILVDPDTYREVFESLASKIAIEQYDDFLKRRNGVVVGEKIMNQFEWEVGDAIQLRSIQHNIDLSLVISGVYKDTMESSGQMETRMLINWQYYDSLIGDPGMISVFWLRLDKPASVLPVIQSVTDYYRMGPLDVSVETESSMLARLTSYTATIQLIIQAVSSVVLFSMLLVTVNTISLSMRERRKEIALMKAIGYKPGHILSLVIGEAILISLVAGFMGIFLAYMLFNLREFSLHLGLTNEFVVQQSVAITGLGISVVLGILSGIVPAYNASRVNVINVLHSL